MMDGVGRVLGESGEAGLIDAARGRQRDSLFMIARLRLGDGSTDCEVRVRNLSPGGLMAEFAYPVEPGDVVTLEMRGLGEVTGTIAWATRGRIGIAFDAPIDPRRVRKQVGGGSTTPVYAKPALTVRLPRR